MKPLSAAEIQKLALELKTSEGDRLQDVRIFQSLIALGFYSERPYWLVFDMNSQCPQMIHLENLNSIAFRSEKKPVEQFLKAHFVGRKLLEVCAPLDLGRVLILRFGANHCIEVRLFPRGQNFIVCKDKTMVAFFKPQVMRPAEERPLSEIVEDGLLKVKSQQWLKDQSRLKESSVSEGASVSAHKNKIEKLNKAIKKIAADIELKENLRWQECGEWMKEHQSADVPVSLSSYVDPKKSFSENLENCFQKSKDIKAKIRGAKRRILEIENELLGQVERPSTEKVRSQNSALRQADARGRTFELESGAVLFVGKSAKDNLRLLRKAKPWHYWLHLRDQPSCHGLIERNKNKTVTNAALHLAAHHLISNNFGEKQKNYRGDKFDIVVAECRFVRPIKGDRHGRVHYSDERTFTHLFQD